MIKLRASIADQAFTAWFGNGGGDQREEAIARDAWTAAIAWVMGNDDHFAAEPSSPSGLDAIPP